MSRRYKDLNTVEIEGILSALAGGSAPKQRKTIGDAFDISPATVLTVAKNHTGQTTAEIEQVVNTWNQYRRIFEGVFHEKHSTGADDIAFTTGDLVRWKKHLGFEGNTYDLKYNAKGRGSLPTSVQGTAPEGREWRIKSTAKGEYVFKLYDVGAGIFELDADATVVKVPDSLPSIVERYSRDDEQALLARIRYNNLISVFLGLSTHSLQSHWKTSSASSSTPMEVDEMYVGVDQDGAHYSIPVEAKGRAPSERITAEQILSNYDAASSTFPQTIVIPVAAKEINEYTFALIKFEVDRESESVRKVFERHYTLSFNLPRKGVPRPLLTEADIKEYHDRVAPPPPDEDDSLDTSESETS